MNADDDIPQEHQDAHNSDPQQEDGWITGPEAVTALSRESETGDEPPSETADTSSNTFREKFLSKFHAEPEALIAQMREDKPKAYVRAVFDAWRRLPHPARSDNKGVMLVPAPFGFTGQTFQNAEDFDKFIVSQRGKQSSSSPQRAFDELLQADFDKHGDETLDRLRESDPVFFMKMGIKLSEDPSTQQKYTYPDVSNDDFYWTKSGVAYLKTKYKNLEEFEKYCGEQQRRLIEEARKDAK